MPAEPFSSSIQLFQRLFGTFPAHAALLDLSGRIISVNKSWLTFGRQNGLAEDYEFESKDYIEICERASQSHYAVEAMIGLLQVLNDARPTFTMVYPCHSPTEQRWFRLWVESQMPQSPSIIMAHSRLERFAGRTIKEDVAANVPDTRFEGLMNWRA